MDQPRVPPQTSRQVATEVYTSRRRKYDPAIWSAAYAQKLAMGSFRPFELPVDADHEKRIREAQSPIFLSPGSGERQVELKKARNPAPRGSLGYAGEVVKVRSKERFFQGILAFPIDPRRTRALVPETLRVFRWHAVRATFELVEPGGLGEGYAWARISSPGTYTLIGLPGDPFKQTLIKITSALAPTLEDMTRQDREALLRSVGRTLADKSWFGSFGSRTMQRMFAEGWRPSPSFPFGFGGFPGDFQEPGSGRRPGWAGWDPDGEICPPMPGTGWPEARLIPDIEPWWDGRGPGPAPDLGWVTQGPNNIPGHSTEVVIDPGDNNRIYTTTANGGLWVLPDVTRWPTGSVWRPLTDLNENLNLQCMAVAASDPQVLYYADGASRLFRSSDRGGTWARTRAAPFDLANRILIDPADSDTVYLATEGGFFRSVNAGLDWENLYFGAVVDAVMDHRDSRIMYLGVRGVGIAKTSDGGSRWETVLPWSAASAPTGSEIRLSLGHQRNAATRTVVARLDQEVFVNRNGGVDATDGTGWSSKGKVGGAGYGWWCFAVGVSPFDDTILLAGSEDLYRTNTGDPPWSQVGGYGTPVHPDFWDVTFDPTRPGVVYCANDGGVYRSFDNGATWRKLEQKLITGQLYATGINGGHAVSGMYHYGIVASSRPLATSGRWQGIEGGSWEFSRIYGDPKRPYYFYVFAGNKLHRRRWPEAGPDPRFDIDWGNFAVTSIAVDPRPESSIILCGASDPPALKRTTMADSSTPTWTDETIALARGEIVTAIAFAPSKPGLAYAITSRGRVFSKREVSSGRAWLRVSTWTSRRAISLCVDPFESGRLFAITAGTIGRLELDGPGWTTVTGSAPDVLPTASEFVEVLAHPGVPGTFFAALEIGVFITTDYGASWQNYDNNTTPSAALPNAPIEDINWADGSLYAVCHGRGLWRRQVEL